MPFQQMLFGLANFFSRNITIFHAFATFLQKQKNYVIFLSKRLQNVAWSLLGDAVYFLYILKNIFRDSSAVIFCGFDRFSRKFLQMSAVPGNAAHRILAQKSSRKGHTAFSGSSDSGSLGLTGAAVPLQC